MAEPYGGRTFDFDFSKNPRGEYVLCGAIIIAC